jgi:cbb3-type cytochrome oxidase subunit 1
MHAAFQVCKALFECDGEFIVLDIDQIVRVGTYKSMFYMTITGEHCGSSIKAIDVVCHFDSSVVVFCGRLTGPLSKSTADCIARLESDYLL